MRAEVTEFGAIRLYPESSAETAVLRSWLYKKVWISSWRTDSGGSSTGRFICMEIESAPAMPDVPSETGLELE